MTLVIPNYETQQGIEEILIKAAAFLDDRRFLEWADLFADDAQYEMLFKSKELRDIDDYLMQFNKEEIVNRMKLLPNYVTDTAKRLHTVSNIRIEKIDGTNVNCTSRFTVYRTVEDGTTTLYAVGSNHDVLVQRAGQWLFLKRRVVLDTRKLEAHTHMPLQ
jgi:3-phenylpropionate/cinnamic acid dioxygenase small subunit